MTKGELRASRKAARAAGRPWSIELDQNGQLEQVSERTPVEERRHQAHMERWARTQIENDPDWR